MEFFTLFTGAYSLRKSRHILKEVYAWYKKRGNSLPVDQKAQLEREMTDLDAQLMQKDSQAATPIAKRLETFAETHCKKTLLDYGRELLVALVLALIIATIVRQMWFELYEIPTGSMRPTFREQDHLTVTKTAFGINFPLETKHLYFDPALVQRTSVLIFSGDGLPLSDTDTTFFGIFPYKKRYIKRGIGKPGDSLYFYGGRLYGVDKEGNDIKELREAPWMQALEYVPFLSFEGETVAGSDRNTLLLRQMHQPIGKLSIAPLGVIQAEIYDGKKWIKDDPLAQLKPHSKIKTYSDFFGFRNYAEARLVTPEQIRQMGEDVSALDKGILYLQLHHTPSLTTPKPLIYYGAGGNSAGIPGYSALIPLQQQHLDALMDQMYTARFVVKGEKAKRYSLEQHRENYEGIPFRGVPDGTYEFYAGKLSTIGWGGIPSDTARDNPLYSRQSDNVQKLFNMGIQMHPVFTPSARNQTLFPHRYAYFRDGDLYMMGAPILKKEDPILKAFHKNEQAKEAAASPQSPYVAFRDYGPPFKNGSLDLNFIRTFGITIPANHYLVLGDNHAMSADSRIFGFVPQNNIQGAPSWIIWPPGERLGAPPQKPYPFMNVPRLIVWSVVALILFAWYLYARRQARKPIFIKLES